MPHTIRPRSIPESTAASLIAGGCQIISAGNPGGLNGTYALDEASLGKFTAVATGIAAGKGLPGGGATTIIYDSAGGAHALGAPDYLNLAVALENYVYAIINTTAALLRGQNASWPTLPATIA